MPKFHSLHKTNSFKIHNLSLQLSKVTKLPKAQSKLLFKAISNVDEYEEIVDEM